MDITSIPRSFVILNTGGKRYPAAVVTGYFAGNAWLKSDQAFLNIIGSSFGVLTFDDNTEYREDRNNIEKPTVEDWINLSNENKEVCYTRWGDPSKCIFYTN